MRRHQQDTATKSVGRDLLDKKMPSSRQTAAKEDETVDKDFQPDPNLNPSKPRGSDESGESDDSESSQDDYEGHHQFSNPNWP